MFVLGQAIQKLMLPKLQHTRPEMKVPDNTALTDKNATRFDINVDRYRANASFGAAMKLVTYDIIVTTFAGRVAFNYEREMHRFYNGVVIQPPQMKDQRYATPYESSSVPQTEIRPHLDPVQLFTKWLGQFLLSNLKRYLFCIKRPK